MIKPNEARRITEGVLNWKQVEGFIKRSAQEGASSITAKITDNLRDQMKALGYKVTEMGSPRAYVIQW